MKLDNTKHTVNKQVKLVCKEFLFPTMYKKITYENTKGNKKAILDAYKNDDYIPIFQNYDAEYGVLAQIRNNYSYMVEDLAEEPRKKTEGIVIEVLKVIKRYDEQLIEYTTIIPEDAQKCFKKETLGDFSYDISHMKEFMTLTNCHKRLVSANNSYTVAKYVYEKAGELCEQGKADYRELLSLSCSSLFTKVYNIIKENNTASQSHLTFYNETDACEYILTHEYPEEVKKVVRMEGDNRDGRGKTLSFLTTLANFPWYKTNQEQTDVLKFKQTLQQSHYGLDEVKQRVIERMIVKQHTKQNKAQIICLVGSPGVGKTSFAKAIAKAMNLPFYKISMSGANDATILKGSNRCWAGATMGQFALSLYKSNCLNPVILIDEIEKAKVSNEGNAIEVLLEALDETQNNIFVDDYLSVGIDLSKVTFICTANYPERIPAPLLDRMEIIYLPDYSTKQRKTIFSKYVLPSTMKQYELSKSQLIIKKDMLDYIVENYSIDGGIRNLQRCADKLCCKAWVALDEGQEKLEVTKDNVKDLLGEGLSAYTTTLDTKAQIGVANAMVVNSINKGGINKIECAYTSGTGKLNITGNLSDMTKESCEVAFEHVKWQAEEYGIDKDFFLNHDILVHFTNSAIPKDGNSAGIALVTAIISALSENKTIDHVSLTGEISLRGNVSKIGGLKQKIEGAKDNGIKTIIYPKDNEKELLEIPNEIKKGIKLIPVETYKEAYHCIFNKA